MEYPEHEKLKAIADKSQSIGDFIEWMEHSKNIMLSKYNARHQEMQVINAPIQDLLAEYFGINAKKLEQEKRDMLSRYQSQSN